MNPSLKLSSSSKESFARLGGLKSLIIFVLLGVILLSGCRKAPTGDITAVQNLYGQRVGVVIRATRYLFGEHGGDMVNYRAHVATDSPGWVYALSVESFDEIEGALSQLFRPVMLSDYTTAPQDTVDLKFDGDLVLVTPNKPNNIIPPDAAITQIITDENLAGLIVIDQDWYLDTKNYKTLGCAVGISLLDDQGNVVFDSKAGLATDGQAKFTNLMQDFLQNLTFSIVGEPSTENIQEAVDEVNAETAESIVARLQEFAPRQ